MSAGAQNSLVYDQPASIEDLIRYGARLFEYRGIVMSPAKLSKIVRRFYRRRGANETRDMLDAFIVDVDLLADPDYVPTWAHFELFVNGYADPVGARVAHSLDIHNAATARTARRRSVT